ncbi:LPD28 domain-containing protein [Lachnospiraceae bacterium JLR.KK009]
MKKTRMEINGVKGYFNDMRIDRNTVPEAFRFWELADGDSDRMPCLLTAE